MHRARIKKFLLQVVIYEDSVWLHVKQIATIKLPLISKQLSRTAINWQNALKKLRSFLQSMCGDTAHTNNPNISHCARTSILIEPNQQLSVFNLHLFIHLHGVFRCVHECSAYKLVPLLDYFQRVKEAERDRKKLKNGIRIAIKGTHILASN